jgi:Raf kinase inhibitor-like YbhB/YbcL family protein
MPRPAAQQGGAAVSGALAGLGEPPAGQDGDMLRTARPGRLAPAPACRRRCRVVLPEALALVVFMLPLTGCGGPAVNAPRQQNAAPLTVSSPDLPEGRFPREFTCDGANRRPRLQWSTPPPGTQELAVELLDPDAPGGTFTHWLVYRLPPSMTSLAAVPAGAAEGVNDFGRRGYGGPCPPRGPAHHYHFLVLALDTRLGLAAGAARPDLDSRVSGHVLAKGELVAAYQRT